MLVAIVLSAATMYAQDTYRIRSVTRGVVNTYDNTIDWGEYKDVDMTLTSKGNVMFISDNAKSIYILKSSFPDKIVKGIKQVAWHAVDESGYGCTFKICTYPSGTKMVYVFYNDYAFGYTLDQ